jgi:electron transfer flavoprotein beta subunit
LAQITYVAKLDIEGHTVRAEREQEDCYEVIEADLPLLVTVVKSINEPRHPNVKGIMKSNRKEIPVWTASDTNADPNRIGLKGSPTQVRRIFAPHQRVQGEIIQADSAREAAAMLAKKLHEAKIV